MYTVAHFSDVHALSLAGVSPFDFLNKRFAGAVNLLTRRRNRHPVRLFGELIDDINRVKPDHVVITGDLTNLSLEPEFELARRELNRLQMGPSGVTLIPGNHDVYVWAARLARSFEKHFAPYLVSDGPDGGRKAPSRQAAWPRASWPFGRGEEYPVVQVRGGMAFVGISTARPSPVPFADGTITRVQLDAVEKSLAMLGADHKFRVVLLHHPPVVNRHAFLRGLRDRGALQDILRRVGAELVVHGHEHRDVRSKLAGPSGPIPVIGVGSATYDDPRADRRARYNLYRIEPVTRRFAVETRVHDAATGHYHGEGAAIR